MVSSSPESTPDIGEPMTWAILQWGPQRPCSAPRNPIHAPPCAGLLVNLEGGRRP